MVSVESLSEYTLGIDYEHEHRDAEHEHGHGEQPEPSDADEDLDRAFFDLRWAISCHSVNAKDRMKTDCLNPLNLSIGGFTLHNTVYNRPTRVPSPMKYITTKYITTKSS